MLSSAGGPSQARCKSRQAVTLASRMGEGLKENEILLVCVHCRVVDWLCTGLLNSAYLLLGQKLKTYCSSEYLHDNEYVQLVAVFLASDTVCPTEVCPHCNRT